MCGRSLRSLSLSSMATSKAAGCAQCGGQHGLGVRLGHAPHGSFFRGSIDSIQLINEEHMVSGADDG